MLKGVQTRRSIHTILRALKNNKDVFEKILNKQIIKYKYSSKDINLIQAVVLESIRYNNQVKTIIAKYSRKKINEDSYILLLSAITQLLYLNFKEYAVVNSSVELAKNLKTSSSFINAILKKIIQNKEKLINTKIDTNKLPNWFLKEFSKLKKNRQTLIIKSINEKPNLHIVFKSNFFLKKFISEINYNFTITSKNSLMVDKVSKIENISRYNKGEWWIQDYSAMLPIYLSKNLKNKTIIDFCAAPGGKTFQSLANNNKVLAVEKDKKRADVLRSNLNRLKFDVPIKVEDALSLNEKINYEVILIDAPCTSVGTIRKNPEILFRNTNINLYKYTETQMKLLNKAATLIKNKGEIIYMVCSFFEQETTTQIKKFLTLNKNFTIIKFDKKNNENENLIDENGFINIVPCTLKNNIRIDGFFAAKLKRND